MNYFAHGRAYIDDPFFLVGTALPDWMNVIDRRNRVRSQVAIGLTDDADTCTATVAAGVVQHHADDAWFHSTRAFAELSLEFARLVRDQLPDDEGFRPHFLGHILVEILLDSILVSAEPERLEAYYAAFDQLDVAAIHRAVERIAPQPVPNLPRFVQMFSQERFLWDYADDAKLLYRLNQVMRRVTLPPLPPSFTQIFASMRSSVASRSEELLLNPALETI
jgi:hypothetical protein